MDGGKGDGDIDDGDVADGPGPGLWALSGGDETGEAVGGGVDLDPVYAGAGEEAWPAEIIATRAKNMASMSMARVSAMALRWIITEGVALSRI